MFAYAAIGYSVGINGFGTQLAFYSALVTGVVGGELGKRARDRNDKLKLSSRWDKFRAEETYKKAHGKTKLSKKEKKQAHEKYAAELESFTIHKKDMPPSMKKYAGRYCLLAQEQRDLFYSIKRQFIRLGVDDAGEFTRRLVQGTRVSLDDLLDITGPDDWDNTFMLNEVKELSKLRLADKKIGKAMA